MLPPIFVTVSILLGLATGCFVSTPLSLLIMFTSLSLIAWSFFWAELKLTTGFPDSERKWVVILTLMTLVALVLELKGDFPGAYAGLSLGMFGSSFMAYVNLRFGAPVVFDYVLPFPYFALTSTSAAIILSKSVFDFMIVSVILYAILFVCQLWRTKRLGKLSKLKTRLRA
jgi:hypothetical protein